MLKLVEQASEPARDAVDKAAAADQEGVAEGSAGGDGNGKPPPKKKLKKAA